MMSSAARIQMVIELTSPHVYIDDDGVEHVSPPLLALNEDEILSLLEVPCPSP